jgi:hypothetical protein
VNRGLLLKKMGISAWGRDPGEPSPLREPLGTRAAVACSWSRPFAFGPQASERKAFGKPSGSALSERPFRGDGLWREGEYCGVGGAFAPISRSADGSPSRTPEPDALCG